MTINEAIDILALCQRHNNGLCTLRECAELAGIKYDTAASARALLETHQQRLSNLKSSLNSIKEEDE